MKNIKQFKDKTNRWEVILKDGARQTVETRVILKVYYLFILSLSKNNVIVKIII